MLEICIEFVRNHLFWESGVHQLIYVIFWFLLQLRLLFNNFVTILINIMLHFLFDMILFLIYYTWNFILNLFSWWLIDLGSLIFKISANIRHKRLCDFWYGFYLIKTCLKVGLVCNWLIWKMLILFLWLLLSSSTCSHYIEYE